MKEKCAGSPNTGRSEQASSQLGRYCRVMIVELFVFVVYNVSYQEIQQKSRSIVTPAAASKSKQVRVLLLPALCMSSIWGLVIRLWVAQWFVFGRTVIRYDTI